MENFTYDNLNRLTSANIGVNIAKSFTYNAIGNLLSKSDVGAYVYPAAGQPFPHAVSSISGGVVHTTFTYDANGNMTSGKGLAITYTAFNKPETITWGANQTGFAHDPEHQRFKQVAASGETIYLNGGGVLSERLIGSGGATQWTDYLFAGGGMVGMRVEHSTPSGTYTRTPTRTISARSVHWRTSKDGWPRAFVAPHARLAREAC